MASLLRSLIVLLPVISVLANTPQRRQLSPILGAWTSKGCYTDTAGARTLAEASYSNTTSMTVEACIAFCTAGNYIYAGVEYAQQCFCDYALQSPGTSANANDCDMPCTGNSAETCGGPNRINIFYSGQPGPSIPQQSFTIRGNDLWVYQGCYTDDIYDRTLPNLGSSVVDGTHPTSEEVNCAEYCDEHGYYYAGLEYGTQCWCGNDIGGTGTLAPDSDCQMACASATDEFCGGRNRLTVFQKDICSASDVPNFWMIAFYKTPPASGPIGHYLVMNQVDSGYSLLGVSSTAGCGFATMFDIQSRVLIAEYSPYSFTVSPFNLLVGLPLNSGETPAFLNNQPPTSDYQIYCSSRYASYAPQYLVGNGRTDLWSLCPNTTANGRVDIVYAPIANHPNYVLSTCRAVSIQMVESPNDC